MELSPYLDGLRRDLQAAAAPGGPDVARAADLLGGALTAAARLCLLEALADAAAEITTQLSGSSVDLRLRGREVTFVVTSAEADDGAEHDDGEQPAAMGAPGPVSSEGTTPAAAGDTEDLARMTLRLPESLKVAIEQAAAAEAISVNAWLVRVLSQVIANRPGPTGPGPRQAKRARLGRRVTGYAQA